MKKPALKDLKAAHPELPQHELNKLYTRSKIRYVDTREKRSRVELAKERGQLVEKKLVINQAAFLFGAMRAKMLAWPYGWARKFVGLKDAAQANNLLTEMVNSGLRELRDMPQKITDPNWLETLEDEQ